KLFIGYSDTTALLSWLTCVCNVSALHGPMIDSRFAKGAEGYDERSFLSAVRGEAGVELAPPGLTTVRSGEAMGYLFGGTLAALLKQRGHDVRGSDQNVYPPMSEFLAAEGIRTMSGYAADNLTPDIDLVVVGNAISRGNAELEAVLERRLRYCSLPEAIRDF